MAAGIDLGGTESLWMALAGLQVLCSRSRPPAGFGSACSYAAGSDSTASSPRTCRCPTAAPQRRSPAEQCVESDLTAGLPSVGCQETSDEPEEQLRCPPWWRTTTPPKSRRTHSPSACSARHWPHSRPSASTSVSGWAGTAHWPTTAQRRRPSWPSAPAARSATSASGWSSRPSTASWRDIGRGDERRFALPEGAREVLLDEQSLSYLGPLPRMLAALGANLPESDATSTATVVA